MKGLLITLLILAVLGFAIYYWTSDEAPIEENGETVFCTLDAQICPDGSYVGRVPPTCEFAACPAPTSTSTDDSIRSSDADIFIETGAALTGRLM